MTTNHRLGELGEEIARLFLQMCGYCHLQGRYRIPGGEIDLIMEAGQVIVFVEVKTRSRGGVAAPEEFVTRRQLARLQRVGQTWLAQRGMPGRAFRFEVVAVELAGQGRGLAIRHYDHLG